MIPILLPINLLYGKKCRIEHLKHNSLNTVEGIRGIYNFAIK